MFDVYYILLLLSFFQRSVGLFLLTFDVYESFNS